MQTLYKHKNKIILLLIVLLSIPFIFNIGLDTDEPFTMGLINHNYSDIINLTKLDIHPPLYYLALKLFLQITTFWTSNIFIKIIFARILSYLFGIISFLYLLKILSLINIRINKYVGILLFILLPLGLGKYNQLTNIRMYELSIMLMCIEIYYILQLHKKINIKYSIILTLSIVLNLYTNYFSGLIAGIYLIIFFIMYIFKKDIKRSLNCFFIGIISIAIFTPWIPIIFNQSSSQNILINNINIKFILEILIPIIILEIIVRKYYSDHNSLLITINAMSIASFIDLIFINLSTFPILRYLCPVIYPLICIFTVIVYDLYRKQQKGKIITVILSLLLIISYSYSVYNVIFNFNIPSISFVKKFNKINESKKTNFNLSNIGLESYRWNASGENHGGGGGNSIYLLSIHKNISDRNYISTYQVIGNGNEKLFKAVFPNVEHYYTNRPN